MKSNLLYGLICGTVLLSAQSSDAGIFRRDKASPSASTGLKGSSKRVASLFRSVIPVSSNKKLTQDTRYRAQPVLRTMQPQVRPPSSSSTRIPVASSSLAQRSQPTIRQAVDSTVDTRIGSLARLRSSLIAPPENLTPVSGAMRRTVRTTAYTHSEADHKEYGRSTAIGTKLRSSRSHNSAAADWSRFPLGTTFRIVGEDKIYVVEDYGSALVGTNTIDIYHPSRSSMNRWGVRQVEIEILKLGCYDDSRAVLSSRLSHPHCLQMYRALARFQLAEPVQPIQLVRR